MVAIVPGNDFFYLVGWSPLPDERLAILLISSGAAVLLINGVNGAEARSQMPGWVTVHTFADGEDPRGALAREWSTLVSDSAQACTVYLSDDARYDHSCVVREALSARAQMGLGSTWLSSRRMVKDDGELAALARSQAINDRVMLHAFSKIEAGMTELQLAFLIQEAFVEYGADRVAFIIVAFGANTAHPHHAPGAALLQEGPVLIDIGCFKDGYASDMTRMAYLGQADPQYQEVHDLVNAAAEAAILAVRPGPAVGQVDQASRSLIAKHGFGDQFVHRTGHGIGLDVHEHPSVTSNNMQAMQAGMTFSIEPGIYLPGKFGVRLEDVVIVEAGGARVLSSLPRTLHRVVG